MEGRDRESLLTSLARSLHNIPAYVFLKIRLVDGGGGGGNAAGRGSGRYSGFGGWHVSAGKEEREGFRLPVSAESRVPLREGIKL